MRRYQSYWHQDDGADRQTKDAMENVANAVGDFAGILLANQFPRFRSVLSGARCVVVQAHLHDGEE
jgi:hypothetical protein